ncbi:MAG: TetR/AcrR family transcriptional regulator [Myxococcota bacterium]
MARPADPTARSSLVAAARREFVKSGIQRARIEDITAACGLSKGAFYLHFESKEALFRELVQSVEAAVDGLRRAREQAYAKLVEDGFPRGKKALAFVAALGDIDRREDLRLLQLLWDWRDVTRVLLDGCQGTEFEGVMWTILDREAGRVAEEIDALKKARFIRPDVDGELVGFMIVGTYMLVARKFATLTEKPDFERLVRLLQGLISEGTASDALREATKALLSTPSAAPTRRPSPPRRR